ncbi:MAG: TetR/AcrR family transcriptional regulator [Burkholderiaceae bacterium]
MAGSNTRDRILGISLALFNSEGVAAVSTHRIATETDISPGNLHYHFKTKQQIVTWLFRRFEARIAPCLEAATTVTAIDDAWLTLHMTFEAIDAYRFVYRDIAFLLHDYPALEEAAQGLVTANLIASRELCARLAAGGVLRASAEDVEMLALQMVFTTTCWFSFTRLVPHNPRSDHAGPGFAAYYTLTLLSPYVLGEARDYLNYLRGKYLG